MNILLFNHYAGSPEYGMVFRPYYMSRELVRMGHKVTIVAGSYSHLRLKNPDVIKDLQEEFIEGIRYIWLKTPRYERSGVGRINNILIFVWKLRKYAKKIGELVRPDLVIASSTYNFEIYTARSIANSYEAKLCYEIRDLWPLTPQLIGGYSKYHPFIWAMQKAEDYAYNHSDKVVSLLWNAEKHCKEHGLKPEKFVCIPNGYDPEEWTDEKFIHALPDVHEKAFESLKDKIIVGFAGSFSPSGMVSVLVKAAAIMKDNKQVHVVLVGKGPEKDSYEKIVRDNNLQNVTILPAVSKNLIPAINIRFDMAFLGGIHSVLHQFGTSYNKMTDYMLSGKPIVQSVDEPGSVVERVGCGIRVEAENAKAVADAIVKLAGMTVKERTAIGQRGKEYVEKNLPWNKLAQDFLKLFES